MGREKIRLGKKGEGAAGSFLRKNGYKIVATNFRSYLGEVDLIAREGQTTVFVEVRTRSSEGHGFPEESVTPAKQKQIYKAALAYINRNNLSGENFRFDVVSVLTDDEGNVRKLKLIRDAFEPEAFLR